MGPFPAAAGSLHCHSYVARWDRRSLSVLTPSGGLLTRWPVGSACSAADPQSPATAHLLPLQDPLVRRTGTITSLIWRWKCVSPDPISEQEEIYRLLPGRVEIQVRVRWRGGPPRLVRMNYGGHLHPGCIDLEGMWSGPTDNQRLAAAPVPGIFPDMGTFRFSKRVVFARSGAHELLMGGVDDADTTFLDDHLIGRTPLDRPARSWERGRQYTFTAAAGSHLLTVAVENHEGPGGIWRGPCVFCTRTTAAAADPWDRASARGTALYHWSPDSYRHPLKGRFTVSLTSVDRTVDRVPENITSGGRFLLPPYLVAIEGARGWWGIGTLDLPRAEDGLRVEWRNNSLTCPFLLSSNTRLHGTWTAGPRLAILTGASRGQIRRGYLKAISEGSSERADRRHAPAWWSGPDYCTWGDQQYCSRLHQPGLSDSSLHSWLASLHKIGIEPPLITLDAGWWNLSRGVIAELHRSGKHVLLWTQPHWAPRASAEIRAHPNWVIRSSTGAALSYDANNWLLDFSVPGARAYFARQVHSYLSAGGWGADGLKLDFPYTAAAIWHRVGNPAWGEGEFYRARVLREIYRMVKREHPDAFLSCFNTNPLFGPVQDVCRLNDDWTGDPQTYRRRAESALAMGEWVDCDDWNAYEHYLPVQALERPVWGCFTLMSSRYRGDRQNLPRPLTSAWSRRLSAILELARHAPLRSGQRFRYEPEHRFCERLDRSGSMVVGAYCLSGMRPAAVVAVEGTRLWVAAISSGRLRIPDLPAVRTGTLLLGSGERSPLPLRRQRGMLELDVVDAARSVESVRPVPDRRGRLPYTRPDGGLSLRGAGRIVLQKLHPEYRRSQ